MCSCAVSKVQYLRQKCDEKDEGPNAVLQIVEPTPKFQTLHMWKVHLAFLTPFLTKGMDTFKEITFLAVLKERRCEQLMAEKGALSVPSIVHLALRCS